MIMKKYLLILIAGILLGSCSNYLDLKPKNVLSPQTLDDVKTLSAKYFEDITSGRFKNKYSIFNPIGCGTANDDNCMFRYMDCDVDFMSMLPFIAEATKDRFQWINTLFHKQVWFGIYTSIGEINLALYELGKVSGNEAEHKQLEAELRMHRALLYTKLLQYFSPYTPNQYAENIDDYGIPFTWGPQEIAENLYPQRLSQRESYRLILEELEEILNLNAKSGEWNMLYNERSIHGLFAEFYWWRAGSCCAEKEDWQKAREHAQLCIAGGGMAQNQEELEAVFNPFAQTVSAAFKLVCPNVWGNTFEQKFSFIEGWGVSKELYDSYASDDIRKDVYFSKDWFGNITLSKFQAADNDKKRVMTLWRAEEMQLIIAESYARTGEEAKGWSELNKLWILRSASYTQEGDLFSAILTERRREFAFEPNYRWLDMKRIGLKIDRPTPLGETFTLEENDFRYTFQIPVEGELDTNPNNFQNPGWDIVKFE